MVDIRTTKHSPPRTYTPKPNPKKIPRAVQLAWEDLDHSIAAVFAKWPSKLVSYEIVKEFLNS